VRGIRRTLGTAKIKKVPATAERLLAMAANTGANLKGLRDRALLLIGFAGALRRSELVALNIEDIETLTPRLDGGRSPEWPAAAHAGGKTDNHAHRPRPRRAAEQRDELAPPQGRPFTNQARRGSQ
jgi:integrase